MLACLTETHLTKDIDDFEINIPNYDVIRNDSTSRNTGGVMFYVHTDLSVKVEKNTTIVMNCWLSQISFKVKEKLITIILVYHSPNGAHHEFLLLFENYVEDLLSNNQIDILLILGDFNLNWNNNDFYVNKLKEIVSDNGLSQIITADTHVTKLSSTKIDLAITNEKYYFKCQVLHTPIITDHFIVRINFENVERFGGTVLRRVNNHQSFKENFNKNPPFNFRENNIDIKFDNFYNRFIKALDVCKPKVEIRNNRENKKWVDTEVLTKIKQRDTCFKRFNITRDPNDWEIYRMKRNEVVEVIKNKKIKYFEDKIDKCSNDPKLMWKTLKQHIKCGKGEKYKQIYFNGILTSTKQEIADNFNQFYVQSIENIIESIGVSYTEFDKSVEECNQNFDDFKLISKDELQEVILALPNKSSPDDLDILT